MRNLRFKLHVRKELSYHQYQKKKKRNCFDRCNSNFYGMKNKITSINYKKFKV